MSELAVFTIEYYAGPYKGTITVTAEDEEQAVVRGAARIRKQMTLSMYAAGYRIAGEKSWRHP